MSLSHLNFPAIGSPRAVGSKFGDTSGTSQDVIYPVSRLVDEAAQEGRTVEFNWKSDSHRFWTPRNTRLGSCSSVAACEPQRVLVLPDAGVAGRRGRAGGFRERIRAGVASADKPLLRGPLRQSR